MELISKQAKREVRNGAAEASVRGFLRLTFTYPKPGITRFDRALISFGHSVHTKEVVNDKIVNRIIAAPKTARSSFTSRESYCRKKIKDSLRTIMDLCG